MKHLIATTVMNRLVRLGLILPVLLLVACGGGGGGAINAPTSSPQVFASDFYLVDETRARSLTGGSRLSGRTRSQIYDVIRDEAAKADTFLRDSFLLKADEINNPIRPINGDQCSSRGCEPTYNVSSGSRNLSLNLTRTIRDIFPNVPLSENTPTLSFDIREVMIKENVSVVQLASRNVRGDDVATSKLYGGWLNGSVFGIGIEFAPALSSTGDYWEIYGFSLGNTPSTNPRGTGRAEWRGLMIGFKDRNRNVVQGDALIDIDNISSPSVDVVFSNVKDLVTGDDVTLNNYETFGWSDLEVIGGAFNAGNNLQGRFYGMNHEEVGGVFHTGNAEAMTEDDGITGAFGGTRQ